MDVKRDAGVCVVNKAAPLARRLVALPHFAACRLPLLARIERLTISGDASAPIRVKFAKTIPHWVVCADSAPMLDFTRLRDCSALNFMLAQPEQNGRICDAELLRDFASAALLENVVLKKPIFLTKDDMLAPVLALLKMSWVFDHDILCLNPKYERMD